VPRIEPRYLRTKSLHDGCAQADLTTTSEEWDSGYVQSPLSAVFGDGNLGYKLVLKATVILKLALLALRTPSRFRNKRRTAFFALENIASRLHFPFCLLGRYVLGEDISQLV
jgi:hypothetical protein